MRSIRLIVQPYKSSLCGHCCVAMLANVPLDVAVAAIGHKNGTTTEELIKALRALGVKCANKIQRKFDPAKVKCAIVRWKDPDSQRGHWSVWCMGWFDPSIWTNSHSSTVTAEKLTRWKLTGYLEVFV